MKTTRKIKKERMPSATGRILRGGTTAECNAITPAIGELIMDTTLKQLRIGNGSTAGGVVYAKPTLPTFWQKCKRIIGNLWR